MPDLPDDIMLPLPDDSGLRLEVIFMLEWVREDSDNPDESGWTCDAYLDGGILSLPDRDDTSGMRFRWIDLGADEVKTLLGKDEIKRLRELAARRAVEDA